MERKRSSTENSIRNYPANIFCIAGLYGGFAFFNHLFIYDIVILLVLTFWLFKKQSIVSSILALAFGVIAFVFALKQPSFAGGWHLGLTVWWIWSAAFTVYYTLKFKRESEKLNA